MLVEGLALMLDTGTTNLVAADGLLGRRRGHHLKSVGRSKQVIRLPEATVGGFAGGAIKRLHTEGWFLDLVTTQLDFGPGIDGVIGYEGIARLEKELGLEIKWASREVYLSLLQRTLPTFSLGDESRVSPALMSRRTRLHASLRRAAACPRFTEQWWQRFGCSPVGRSDETSFLAIARDFFKPEPVLEELVGEDVVMSRALSGQEDGENPPDDRPEEWKRAEEELRKEFADVLVDKLESPPAMHLQTDVQLKLPPWDPSVPLPSQREMNARIPISPPESEFIARDFDNLKAIGVLEPSTSPFNASVFPVPKNLDHPDPQKRYRVVINFRPVNRGFPGFSTSFPLISEIVSKLSACKVLCAGDIAQAFHQVGVLPEDRDYLSVTHPSGEKLRFTAWPLGFVASPYAMQRFGEPLVRGVDGAGI